MAAGRLVLSCVYTFDYRGPGPERWTETVRNLIVTEGLDFILEAMFHGGPQVSPWRVGLIDNAGFTAITSDDTAAAHPGWAELTSYAGDRPPLAPVSVAGGTLITVEAVAFLRSLAGVVRGAFIASEPGKLSAAGTLWSATAFGTARSVKAAGTLSVSVTLTAAGGG